MREPRRLEGEVRILRGRSAREHELAPEVRQAERVVVIVSACEFPRFKSPRPGMWQVNHVAPERPGGSSHWRQKGLSLARYKLGKDAGLVVVLFDFDRGTLETVRLDAGRLRVEPVPRFVPRPIVDSDYRVWGGRNENPTLSPITRSLVRAKRVFSAYCPYISQVAAGAVLFEDWMEWLKKNGKLGHPNLGLGIEHVYEFIEELGRARPGALIEFHQLGHASSSHQEGSGTAFVNTWEWWWIPKAGIDRTRRSPFDLDARGDVDFRNRSPDFARAFASTASSQVWGCNWHVPDHAIFTAVLKELGSRPLTDAMTFTIPIGNTQLSKEEFEQLFTRPFGDSSRAAPGSLNAAGTAWSGLTGKWLRAYFATLLDRTYMKALAHATKRPVLGGLPGTSSEYDTIPTSKLAHIPMGGPYSTEARPQSFLRVMRFFKREFGTTFGPGLHPEFGRGFAWYEP